MCSSYACTFWSPPNTISPLWAWQKLVSHEYLPGKLQNFTVFVVQILQVNQIAFPTRKFRPNEEHLRVLRCSACCLHLAKSRLVKSKVCSSSNKREFQICLLRLYSLLVSFAHSPEHTIIKPEFHIVWCTGILCGPKTSPFAQTSARWAKDAQNLIQFISNNFRDHLPEHLT